MPRQHRLLKSLLMALLVAVTVAIAANLARNLGENRDPPPVTPLEPTVSQLTSEMESWHYDGDAVTFRVHSEESRINADGLQELSKVHVEAFRPPERNLTDEVWARSGLYNAELGQVDFRDDVVIALQEGTKIASHSAAANLSDNSHVVIKERFRLERGSLDGEGESLNYDARDNVLKVEDGLQLRIPYDGGVLHSTSQTATYWPRAGRLLLAGGTRIQGASESLVSDDLDLELTAERRIERATATGNVVYANAQSGMEGDQLKIQFEPVSGQVTNFLVTSDAPRKSLYRAEPDPSGQQGQVLAAREIEGSPTSGSSVAELAPDRLQARGDVRVEWRQAGIEEATALSLAKSRDPVSGVQTLHFSGGASLRRRVEQGRETVSGQEVVIAISSAQALENLVARGQPGIVATDSQGRERRVTAREEIRIDFRDGLPQELRTIGSSEIYDALGNRSTRIQASALVNEYRRGKPHKLVGAPPVRLELKGEGSPVVAKARHLEFTYSEDGVLEQGTLDGGLTLQEERPQGSIDLTGSEGILSKGGEEIEVHGGETKPLLRSYGENRTLSSETRASSFRVTPGDSGIVALGDVQTIVEKESSPLRIEAGRMEAIGEESWITYEEKPVFRSGQSRIAATSMQLNTRTLELRARGDVVAQLQVSEKDIPIEYLVNADRLNMDREANTVSFSGHVRARTEKFTTEADEMQLRFSGTGLEELNDLLVSGHVTFVEKERRAHGEAGTYVPAAETVTILGEKAEVVDSKQGKAIGKKLTFHLGNDTLLIEGQP